MNSPVDFCLGILASLAATVISLLIVPGWRFLLDLFRRREYNISGDWVCRYEEPDGSPTNSRKVEEHVTLRQRGLVVSGKAVALQDGEKTEYQYTCWLRRQLVVGHFTKKGDSSAAGFGAVVVEIAATDNKMVGKLIWWDGDLMGLCVQDCVFTRN